MWQYNCMYSSDELYHYGILGMKWGVRRYQNKDGSLTTAGRKRYGDTDGSQNSEPKKSKHRLSLESRFKKAGLSDEEAAKQADKRIRTEKILAAVGITTVVAASAYVAHKHIKTRSDSLIKAGDTLHRIKSTDGDKLHDVFYASADKTDKTKYIGMLGKTRSTQSGRAYLMDIGVEKDIKVAGRGNSLKTFKKLYDTDDAFRKAIDDVASTNAHFSNPAGGNVKKLYDNFNSKLYFGGVRDADGKAAVSKFYGALKSQGYGAIQDVNDMKFSGFNAKNPLIVFGQSNNVAVKTVKELGRSEINKNLVKDGTREVGKMLSSTAAMTIPVATLGSIPMTDEQIQSIAKSVTKSTGGKK